MAIGTYAELQTAVANWLERGDLTTRIPEFISLAESRFKRTLKHWRMEQRKVADTVAGQRALQLPTDYLKMRTLKLNTTTQNVLEFQPPSVLYDFSYGSGEPKYYTVQENQLILEPIPDAVYEVEMGYYYFSDLSDTNTTNWLLTYFPDVYLYGTLVQAEAFIFDDKRIALWKSALDEALKEVNKDDKEARWSGAPLIMRVEA